MSICEISAGCEEEEDPCESLEGIKLPSEKDLISVSVFFII